jgi:GNAT superfamily N-acetyltransferase
MADYAQWRPLWDGYNAFYGRSGETSLDDVVTAQTWKWFFEPDSGVRAFVAEMNGQVIGLVHYVFHRSTSRLRDVCYLQDLFTSEGYRGNGVGRALMEQVIQAAARAGSSRVYWTTQATNAAGRALYDKLVEYRDFIVYSHEI